MIFKTKKQQARYNSICPNGLPKKIRVYDNGGETADRYTVVYTGSYTSRTNGGHWYTSMNAYPFHPQGIGCHGESEFQPIDRPSYKHLGKKIKFEDLPEDCQKLTMQDYLYLWDFKDDDGNVLR